MEIFTKYTQMFMIIEKEAERQKYKVEQIASENFVSKEVCMTQGTVLTNKYAEGYPGKCYYGSCVHMIESENLTIQEFWICFGQASPNLKNI